MPIVKKRETRRYYHVRHLSADERERVVTRRLVGDEVDNVAKKRGKFVCLEEVGWDVWGRRRIDRQSMYSAGEVILCKESKEGRRRIAKSEVILQGIEVAKTASEVIFSRE